MESKKTGRPRKAGGPRRRDTFYLPESLLAAIDTYAHSRGMRKIDVVEEALAAKVGHPSTTQEGLSLNEAS
jgi:hypothetical protein